LYTRITEGIEGTNFSGDRGDRPAREVCAVKNAPVELRGSDVDLVPMRVKPARRTKSQTTCDKLMASATN
jgi:hypothetical protein